MYVVTRCCIFKTKNYIAIGNRRLAIVLIPKSKIMINGSMLNYVSRGCLRDAIEMFLFYNDSYSF